MEPRAYARGVFGVKPPPLSLIFYEKFITCAKEITFCLLICRLNANTME